MDLLKQPIDKIIIISLEARDFFDQPPIHEVDILETENIKKEIKKLLYKDNIRPVVAVIFLHFDEYRDCLKLLSVLPFTDITYQIIIFGKISSLNEISFEEMKDISDFREGKISSEEFVLLVRKSLSAATDSYVNRSLQESYLAKLMDTRQDQDDLINIGRSLSIEKDPDKLLRMILYLSKRITGADAGSIYLVEEDEQGLKRLRFKYSHTFSREIPLEEFVIPMDKKSIAGYVAVTGEVLNIPDVYNLSVDEPYSYNSSFDKQNNYTCRSMLVVPMKNHVDEIIGVIQLINSKEDTSQTREGENEAFTIKLMEPDDFENHVVTFNSKYDSLMESVAGQAAIAIENNRMISQIQHQFEEFVKASVMAIESRDPATSGHSFRVAEICTKMARAVNNIHDGYLKDYNFSDNDIRELEFAALLHDFGKVYIDLAVFKKAKKLYPKDFDNLNLRLNYLYKFIELQYAAREAALLKQMTKFDKQEAILKQILQERDDKLSHLREIKERLTLMNEPSVMNENPKDILNKIAGEIDEVECINVDGDRLAILSDYDIMNLSIERGSLNPVERKEIESHVLHTYSFVSKIPWPPEYKNIPLIALQHHEKLNGKGYPAGLKGRENILLQSRIMSVADVYDALSASDRPYKKAVPLEKVLIILKEEADHGSLDPDLVDLFIKKKIYKNIKDFHTSLSIEKNAS